MTAVPSAQDVAESSTPPPAGGDAAEGDLDFSDLKKKKKTSKKKAAFDMEAFEKELNDTKARDDEEEGEDGPARPMEEFDEEELGDDVFAQGAAPAALEAGNEAWLKSDRDYTYPEVSLATGSLLKRPKSYILL